MQTGQVHGPGQGGAHKPQAQGHRVLCHCPPSGDFRAPPPSSLQEQESLAEAQRLRLECPAEAGGSSARSRLMTLECSQDSTGEPASGDT